MALLRPILVATLTGLIGGVEYSATRAGQVARPMRITCRTETPAILYERSRFAELSSSWRTLSEADRASWRTAAKLLPVISLQSSAYAISGFHLFLAMQPDPRYLEVAPPLGPAPIARTPSPETVSCEFSASGAYTVTSTGDYPKTYGAWERIYAARCRPTPGAPQPKCWKLVGLFNHLDTSADYKAYFALADLVFQEGETVAVSVQWWWSQYFPAMPITAYCTVGS